MSATALQRIPFSGVTTQDSYVVQANSLARSRYDGPTNLHALRLLIVSISKIDQGAQDLLGQITVTNRELRELFPSYAKSKTLCERMQDATDRMMNLRAQCYLGPGKWEKVNLIHKASYLGALGGLTITFAPEMKDLLLKLTGSYTRYQIKSVSRLATANTIVLYQFLRSHAHHRVALVGTADLRSLFSLEDSQYKEFKDFRRRLIEPALKEINESSDLVVGAETVMTGRSVGAVRFRITVKAGEALSPFTAAVISMMVAQGVDAVAAKSLGVDLPMMEALGILAYARYQQRRLQSTEKPVRDMGAYTANCLRTRVPLPSDDEEYGRWMGATMRKFRLTVFESMKDHEKDSIKAGFSETLQGRQKMDWDRLDGPETGELREKFGEFLRGVITPDAPKWRLTMS